MISVGDGMKGFPYGTAPTLDLGWCKVRQLTAEAGVKLARVQRSNSQAAFFAFPAGLSIRQYKALTDERRAELRYAVNWTMMPYSPPTVGTLIPGDSAPV